MAVGKQLCGLAL